MGKKSVTERMRVVSRKNGDYQGQCACGYVTHWYFLDTTAASAVYEHTRTCEVNNGSTIED